MAKNKYSEKDISYFATDLEKIRAKTSMYIGAVDDDGIFTIVREPADNGVDEARAGRNNLVAIYVDAEHIWVQDAGVGIPVKLHPQAKISTLTHVLTALQSSGKMKGDAYTSSIGVHGVGIKATNATSSSFEVWTYRDDAKGWWYTKFEQGVEKVKPRQDKAPKLPDGSKAKLGTIVKFTPDTKIFGKAKLRIERVRTWAEITAYMNACLKVKVWYKGKQQEWFSKVGIQDYLAKRIAEAKATPISKKFIDYKSKHLEVAVAFTDVEGCEMEFYTNTVRNVDAGFHADAFFRALLKSLESYRGKLEYTLGDLKEGMLGVLNLKVDAPQFSSQSKEKLVDVRIKEPCYQESLKLLTEFWAANKTLAKDVVTRAAELRKKTADFLKDKKLSRNVKAASKGLTAKLAGVIGNAPVSERELYLVEGDSAGGTAKLARYKPTQAVFALKGKPLNVMEVAKDKVYANKEIAGILAGIGIDPGAKNPLARIGYGKIVFLADPDVDGRHINTLLMGLFWKYAPSLYRDGKIFIVAAPEFYAVHKGQYLFADSKEEIYKQAGSKTLEVKHIKGWGEIAPEPMRAIAFKRGARKLWRIDPPKDKKGQRNFEAMLGKDPTYRKQMLGLLPMTLVKTKKGQK